LINVEIDPPPTKKKQKQKKRKINVGGLITGLRSSPFQMEWIHFAAFRE
jgi:hypothetical protein